jgi:hypothetical protein
LDDVVSREELGALDGADCEARKVVIACADITVVVMVVVSREWLGVSSFRLCAPGWYIPGISAVSPPMRAQPDCWQPVAMPFTTSAAIATSSLPQP